ncbi:hypothetical protein OS175_10870 [Marinicella sp. S1101]|uniref:hypothetical protein n=1 Tax=Marinicella marina TaxID=2996016 RepID=UPI0022608210|nr:hypothetical protein [Marinicella marina]MCX7554384.1 hypothetical protein [Marinicella marina]MDJ1138625.1 hypothetical protein [Marinicella marina]
MKKYLLMGLLLISLNVSAVYINHKGLGEVLILPYYTVNNGLNTLVTVTNSTSYGKAIKVNIREGLHGYSALSYNIYLDAYDVWTFALVPTASSIEGYQGQLSAMQISNDTSCAPGLRKSGQEFLPNEIIDGSNDLERTREGFIEVIEMATFFNGSNVFGVAEHGVTGVPQDCDSLASFWQENGMWHEETGGNVQSELLTTTGGLMADAQIIDVAQGINYSVPSLAFDGFHAENTIAHVNPEDSSLSLDSANPMADIMAHGQSYKLATATGIDAVTAVLMADKLVASYALDTVVAGINESIFTQPTRRFYVNSNDTNATRPFNSNTQDNDLICQNTAYGGIEIKQFIFDRASQEKDFNSCNFGAPCPVLFTPAICGSVFVQGYDLGTSITDSPDRPLITNSKNSTITKTPAAIHATENGFVVTSFPTARTLPATETNTGSTVNIHGIPVTGISLQRFTNAGAGEGLLAQYGGSEIIKSSVTVTEDN